MNMTRSSYTATIASILAMICAVEVEALAPSYVADKELVDFPIIVVARWRQGEFHAHHRYRDDKDCGRVITQVEAYTTLQVVRTIKGGVNPGLYPLMVRSGIGWSKDGTYVSSATSTEILGDVNDVTTPNIWFLKRQRSWDEKDEVEYLSIQNYRAIQPLTLEPYFAALRSGNPEREVPKLLNSDEPEVIRRTLHCVCGNHWPWPYDTEFRERYLMPEKRGNVLSNEVDAVEDVINRPALDTVRPIAVAVYGEIKGETGRPFLAGVLADRNPDVRGMALAVLARQQSAETIDAMIGAANGVTNGWMACKIIEAVQRWGDYRLAPVLIAFLQDGASAGFSGDDFSIPANKARQALERMTGHVFPYDVAASSAAWKKVEGLSSFEERKRLLGSLLPCDRKNYCGESVRPTVQLIVVLAGVITLVVLAWQRWHRKPKPDKKSHDSQVEGMK